MVLASKGISTVIQSLSFYASCRVSAADYSFLSEESMDSQDMLCPARVLCSLACVLDLDQRMAAAVGAQ
jgi:hypothetical protein